MKKVVSKMFYVEKEKKIIYSLYSLRFIFFIFIFVHHCYDYVEVPFLRQPSLAVSGFFILSGFLNAYIYIEKSNIKDTLKFTFKRIKKFWPLHIILLLIMVAISGVFSFSTSKEFITFIRKVVCNIFLLQSWINNKDIYFSFNGATWFLSTYLFLCLTTIPILCILKRINKKRHRNLLLFVASIILLMLTLGIAFILRKQNYKIDFYEYWLYIFPPSRVFEYTIGMIFGTIFKNTKISFKHDRIVFSILEILAIAILIIFIRIDIPNKTLLFQNTFNNWIIPVVILIMTLSYQKGIISKLLSGKIFVYLGKISMYTFIIHQPLIIILTKYVGKPIHYRYFALYMLLLTIMIGIIINKYYNYKSISSKEKQ